VETTVRGLRKYIVGKTIVSAWTEKNKVIKTPGSTWLKVKRAIEGKKISTVTRRAKYIVVNLGKEGSIYIHQKMSGHLLVGKWAEIRGRWQSQQKGPLAEDFKNQHIRMMLTLNNGKQVALSDTRRFATITYVRDPVEHDHLRKLGPEPLDISLTDFYKLFESKKGNLKPVLMDPRFIVGIGNIYADEILWRSGLHPLSRVENLTKYDYNTILTNTKTVFVRAIKMGGSSVDDYRTSTGEAGEFQNLLNAYQRTGERCAKRDGGIIQRIMVGQRSTHFCPKHQRRV